MDFRILLFRIINISKLWDTSRLTKFKRIISYSVNLAHLWVDFRTFFHLFCNDFPMFFSISSFVFPHFLAFYPYPKSPQFLPPFFQFFSFFVEFAQFTNVSNVYRIYVQIVPAAPWVRGASHRLCVRMLFRKVPEPFRAPAVLPRYCETLLTLCDGSNFCDLC